MTVALDTNILAYAEGVNGVAKRDEALALLRKLPQGAVVVPTQALGELFNVLVLKAKRPRDTARAAVMAWRDSYAVSETSAAVMINAIDLATEHETKVWDAVMLSAAAEAQCRLLLSEDLQDGFTWRGVTVTNPFGARPHVLLQGLLGEAVSDEADS